MKAKLQALEKKIIVGGENLLEKAETQERLLDESAKGIVFWDQVISSFLCTEISFLDY